MRISDWSSDVCSSDLGRTLMAVAPGPVPGAHWHQRVAISCHDGVLSAANALLTGKASKTARALGPGNKSRDDSLGVARVDRSRSEERRVGKEGVSTWRSWGSL